MSNQESVYQKNIETFSRQSADYQQQADRISLLRLIFFLIGAAGLFYLLQQKWMVGLLSSVALVLVLFVILVRIHQKLRFNKKHCDFLVQINQEEIARLHLDLKNFADGIEFQNTKHPYSIDLDLFGRHSLYQLLNRTTTHDGAHTLAQWMLKPSDRSTINERQVAIKELSSDLEWSQDFQARGMHFASKKISPEILLAWINQPNQLQRQKYYRWLRYLLPLVAVVLIGLYFMGQVPYYFPLLSMVVNGTLLSRLQPLAKDTYESTYRSIQTLSAYQAMIGKIEARSFEAPRLKSLQSHFLHPDYRASQAIKGLKDILSRIETRQNAFYWIFNPIFMLDVFWLWQAENWKRANREHVSTWFSSISELEVLNGLAGWHYSQPNNCFPTIAEKPYRFTAEEMGHALLAPADRICNYFALNGEGAIVVLTGSNMSGKSTFLRTIGTNAVLAYMGCPVCAQRFELSLAQIFTSMRTTDSLEESVSSFYAELKRLKQLLELVDQGEPVLFLLDEILKGTNSHDRHQGAAALIKQLGQRLAFGLVSTHDLSLGSLAEEQTNIENYSFNSQMEGDRIIFDYQLRTGICKSFNASQLMAQIGIKLDQPSSTPGQSH